MSQYIKVHCSCGRTLRVKSDREGKTVRCWDCHAELTAPRIKRGEQLARESLESARGALRAESFIFILVGGLVMASALAIPRVGVPLAAGLLVGAGVLYRWILRGSGLHGTPDPESSTVAGWHVPWIAWAWGLVLAIGLVAPFYFRHAILERTRLTIPHAGLAVGAVALACWLAFPALLLVFSACDRTGTVGARDASLAMWRHPLATAVALLCFPLGMILIEAGLVALTCQQNWFSTFVFDFFPPLDSEKSTSVFDSIIPFEPDDRPFAEYFRIYGHGLVRGYTLLGTLPATLPLGSRTRLCPRYLIFTHPHQYLLVRTIFAALIFVAAGSLLAIQARLLGLIPAIDTRQAPSPLGRPV